ncbi:MAG: thiamine-phosphate kinase [Flavobacteriales bacterium]
MQSGDQSEKTELSELGEFGLIEHIAKQFKNRKESTIKGIGDDAAVLGKDSIKTVVSTDLLLEGIHFNLTYSPLQHLGYKAVVVNLSDICAMNAEPEQVTVSIGLSARFSLEDVDELYAGIRLACEGYGVDLVGGDTSTSLTGLTISVTAIGKGKEKELVYRDGGKRNELICVSGDLGAAYLGLQILERERIVFEANPNIKPDLEGHDYLLQRQLKPEARTDVLAWFRENKVKPTSMIDVSDGLASDVLHLCRQAKTGCAIYEDKIPIDPTAVAMADEFKMIPTICALNGGEDYELLFTARQSDYNKISGCDLFSVIGHMTEAGAGCKLLSRDGVSVPLSAQGWNAFPGEDHHQ